MCSLVPKDGSRAVVLAMRSESAKGQAALTTLTLETTPLNVQLTPDMLHSLVLYTAQHTACMRHLAKRAAAQTQPEYGEHP